MPRGGIFQLLDEAIKLSGKAGESTVSATARLATGEGVTVNEVTRPSVEDTFLRILRRRYPDRAWSIVRPGEQAERPCLGSSQPPVARARAQDGERA